MLLVDYSLGYSQVTAKYSDLFEKATSLITQSAFEYIVSDIISGKELITIFESSKQVAIYYLLPSFLNFLILLKFAKAKTLIVVTKLLKFLSY